MDGNGAMGERYGAGRACAAMNAGVEEIRRVVKAGRHSRGRGTLLSTRLLQATIGALARSEVTALMRFCCWSYLAAKSKAWFRQRRSALTVIWPPRSAF